MHISEILSCLEESPVIAAVSDDKWSQAIVCPSRVIFYLSADLLTVAEKVCQAHEAGKYIMVHIDLAEGIGKDRAGIRYLAQCGVDGIISTKAQMIRFAKEQGLLTVQRFFALDSKGVDSIADMLRNTNPHLMEIMPGLVPKVIKRYMASGLPVIAGGLIQTKAEVTDALGAGATAVSTGMLELCYL